MFPFTCPFPPWPGGSFTAFLFVLYPWLFTGGLIAFLRWKRLIPEVSSARLAVGAGFSLINLVLLFLGFSYEAQITQEMLVPTLVFYPYLRARVRSLRLLALVLFPLVALVLAEQVKATQGWAWSYVLEGNKYLLWARPEGTLWEKLLYFGGQPYPAAEFAFYIWYIIGTFAYLCTARSLFPRSTCAHPGLRKFFPIAYGLPLAVILPLIVWYVAERGDLPFHATAAAMSLALLWVMYLQSPAVRRFASTPLFAAMAIFAFFQTSVFEIYHSSVMGHWIYLPENGVTSLASWLDWRFPAISFLGMKPRPWPLEEFVAYITLYNFVHCWVLWIGGKLGLRLLR